MKAPCKVLGTLNAAPETSEEDQKIPEKIGSIFCNFIQRYSNGNVGFCFL